MLRSFLLSSLLLPATTAAQLPSSRHLPDDRTLVLIEIPDLPAILERRSEIVQVGAFDVDFVRRLLDFIGEDEEGFGRLRRRLPVIGDCLLAFDRGITLTSVFARRARTISSTWIRAPSG